MAFAGLISSSRPTPSLQQERDSMNYSTFCERIKLWRAQKVAGCKRVIVQALETSSKPAKDNRREKPFVEPSWLFSSDGGANLGERDEEQESTCGRSWLSVQTANENQPNALYYIVISTAHDEKAGLSEPNAGILLSMIGENGNALMQKIPGIGGSGYLGSKQPGEGNPNIRFQRGSVDIITVVGPDLGCLAALWVAPQSGTWRVEKASVTILPWQKEHAGSYPRPSGDLTSLVASYATKESQTAGEWKGLFHLFNSNEALIGDGAWVGAAELKPSFVQETSDVVTLQDNLLKWSPQLLRSLETVQRLRDESMNEYKDLKLSLLCFSAILVAVGTISLAALDQSNLAEGFAAGGVGGFVYLLLLQRAVDQLPGSTSSKFSGPEDSFRSNPEDSNNESPTESEHKLAVGPSKQGWSPLPGRVNVGVPGRVALVAAVVLVLGRLSQGGVVSNLPQQELLAGVVGFLTSKVAVLLAALNPISSSPTEKKNSDPP